MTAAYSGLSALPSAGSVVRGGADVLANALDNPKAAMETLGFKNARHYLETYVHPANATDLVAEMWDGKNLAKPLSKKDVKH